MEATRVASQFPGVFLFSELARLSRPVRNLALDRIEMIGSFEQAYRNIAVIPDEIIPNVRLNLCISLLEFSNDNLYMYM